MRTGLMRAVLRSLLGKLSCAFINHWCVWARIGHSRTVFSTMVSRFNDSVTPQKTQPPHKATSAVMGPHTSTETTVRRPPWCSPLLARSPSSTSSPNEAPDTCALTRGWAWPRAHLPLELDVLRVDAHLCHDLLLDSRNGARDRYVQHGRTGAAPHARHVQPHQHLAPF